MKHVRLSDANEAAIDELADGRSVALMANKLIAAALAEWKEDLKLGVRMPKPPVRLRVKTKKKA